MKSFVSLAALFASSVLAQSLPDATGTMTVTESCVFKPTQTIIATTGCPTTCATVNSCTADNAITLDCGCTSMKVSPTTTTACPTTTNCLQCTTAWGIAVVTPTTCAAAR